MAASSIQVSISTCKTTEEEEIRLALGQVKEVLNKKEVIVAKEAKVVKVVKVVKVAKEARVVKVVQVVQVVKVAKVVKVVQVVKVALTRVVKAALVVMDLMKVAVSKEEVQALIKNRHSNLC